MPTDNQLLARMGSTLHSQVLWATAGHTPHDRSYTYQDSSLRVWQVLEGRATITVKCCEPQLVETGQAYVVLPWLDFRLEFDPEPEPRIRGGLFRFEALGSFDLCDLFDFPTVVGGEAAQQLGQTIARIAGLRKEMNRGSLSALVEHQRDYLDVFRILTGVGRQRSDALTRITMCERLIPSLILMEQSLSKPITRADLARSVCLSEQRYFELFKESFGASPMAYLQRLRISRAQDLLVSDRGLSLAQIADSLGYADSAHFCKAFKKAVGVTPGAYRKSGR